MHGACRRPASPPGRRRPPLRMRGRAACGSSRSQARALRGPGGAAPGRVEQAPGAPPAHGHPLRAGPGHPLHELLRLRGRKVRSGAQRRPDP
eukprot:7668799-Pyramimonas_sp.AAC.1